jgi:hypothetical protein
VSESVRNANCNASCDPDAGREPAASHEKCDDLFQGHYAEQIVPSAMTLEMDQEEIAPPAAVICFTFAELRRQMMAISATKLLVGKRPIIRDDPCPPLHVLKTLEGLDDATEVAQSKNLY